MPTAGPLYNLTPGSGPYTTETGAKKAKDYANTIRAQDPTRAAIWDYVASQPAPLWCAVDYGAAHGPSGINDHLNAAAVAKTAPIFVLYSIPNRDNGNHSAPDEPITPTMYRGFVDSCAAAIAGRPCIWVIEPDALSKCYALGSGVNSPESVERKDLIRYAVQALRGQGSEVRIYIDAGDNAFRPASEMAVLLAAAGVEYADGVSLNVAHTERIEDEHTYYLALRSREPRVRGFVCDTGRAGSGPYRPHSGDRSQASWCNPPAMGTLDGLDGRPTRPTEGVSMGPPPTTQMDVTGVEGLHALLWIKFPGSSDGSQPGVGQSPEKPAASAPDAGKFYPSYWENCWRASQGLNFSRWSPFVLEAGTQNPSASQSTYFPEGSLMLKQGAATTLILGPFLDPSGAPITNLTAANTSVKLSKGGSALSQKSDATPLTHLESGFYSCSLSAADLDVPGVLTVIVVSSGMVTMCKEYNVISTAGYTSIVAGSSPLPTKVIEVAAGAINNAAIASDAISSSKISSSACEEIADYVLDEQVRGHAAAGSLGSLLSSVASRLPANLVGGKMDSQVGPVSLVDGAITAAKITANTITEAAIATNTITPRVIANNAFNSAKFATDAVAKIQDGLARGIDLSTSQTALGNSVAALSVLVTSVLDRLPPALVGGRIDAHVGSADPTTLPAGPSLDDIGSAVWGKVKARLVPDP